MRSKLSNRQVEIINVALELIAEKGIQGLTIKNLARKIGFSESAIYRHFENKVEIIIGALDYFNGIAENYFTQEIKREDNAKNKIRNMFFFFFETFLNHPSVVAVVFSEEIFRNEKVLLNKVSEVVDYNYRNFIEIIEKGQRMGEIRNDLIPSHLSTIITGALRMFVQQWHLKPNSFDLKKKGSDFVDSINILISP